MINNKAAKQKAEELIEKYLPYAHSLNPEGELRHSLHLENAKKCAIIGVDLASGYSNSQEGLRELMEIKNEIQKI